MAVGLAADAAAGPHLPHHLGHGPVGYARVQLSAQAHGDWWWPHPLAMREKISATASRSSGLVGLTGCPSAQ